ncbi:MAG: hypothetical protein MJZ13_00700 [Bacteroidales bacterium]|nr:hypothetical protein [Bacteroidales bacterium]
MAKQPKFSADRLASELLSTGDATTCKVDFMLSHIASLAATIIHPASPTGAFMLSNVADNLMLHGFSRTRLSLSPTAPDGVERLIIRYNGFSIRLALRITGAGREISCTYLSGSVKLPQLISINSTSEFITRLENISASWMAEWERVLFIGWQNAHVMEKASAGLEAFISEKAKSLGFKYDITMLTNYAEVTVCLCQGIKLMAKVPHTKYEHSIENLFNNAIKVNETLVKLPDDILITA